MRHTRDLLRYKADAWAIATVALAATLLLLPLAWSLSPVQAAVLWLSLFVLRRIATAAQHNHAHLSVFGPAYKNLNLAYDIVLAQLTGLITPEWELHHNRGHHRDYQDPQKDLFSVVDPSTGRPMSRLRYSVRSSLRCWQDSLRIARSEGSPAVSARLVRRFWWQLGIQAALLALMAWIDPLNGLLFGAVQAFLVRCSVAWSSYWHHQDVPMTCVYDSSRTLISPLHNRISFNSGHHTAHHERPTLHWSLLPARTQVILHLIPASCIRNQDAPKAS